MNRVPLVTRIAMLEYRSEQFEDSFKRIDENFFRLNEKIDDVEQRLNEKIDTVEQRLNEKIDTVEQRLNDKIDTVEQRLNDKIDTVEQRLNDKIDKMDERNQAQFLLIADKFNAVHQQFAVQTRWILTGLLATGTMISILLPVVMRLSEIYLK